MLFIYSILGSQNSNSYSKMGYSGTLIPPFQERNLERYNEEEVNLLSLDCQNWLQMLKITSKAMSVY
jgi:hypothetical protein